MNKSALICEGSTDYVLLQYYMIKALEWKDDPSIQGKYKLKIPGQKYRSLIKNDNILTIMACGGCSRLMEGLQTVLNKNKLTPPDMSDLYSKIVIITDRDEADTEGKMIESVKHELDLMDATYTEEIQANDWIEVQMRSQMGMIEKIKILLLVIPFEERGAMETFLLQTISASDPYEKQLIDDCISFVDTVDSEKRYLVSRRHITKAKFDTYFSVRTPVEQFVQRQSILKNVPWEQYTKIQEDFSKLEEI